MQERYLFEYAVVRVVPCVEREEFLNVGVILYCRQKKFLQTKIALNEERLCSFHNRIDIPELKKHLQAFEQVSTGDMVASPIAKLDIASRFRWLTATRSTMLQASKVHPGLCTNPAEALERLYQQLVL
jgi:hypothetical protein